MKQTVDAQARGFTLIELMVTLVIAGVIAAVAYPAYTAQVQKSRRADAIALLTSVVQAQERYRSNRNAYASDSTAENGPTALSTLGINTAAITNNYTIAVARLPTAVDYASGYTLTATVKPGSLQANDARCANLKITLSDATLTYTATTDAGVDSSNSCWTR